MFSRKSLITIHLYLAALFTPVVLVMAISGGLYLLGIKGEIKATPVFQGAANLIDFNSSTLEDDIRTFLSDNKLSYQFEYLKGNSNVQYTRPTSKTHLVLRIEKDNLTITEQNPDFIKSLVELHKGHGPSLFKLFQKFTALGLIFILISGFILGVTSAQLKIKTLSISAAGLLIFVLLAIS
ncbi:PepSY-associated TM helix domain-containing protein [Aliikangiella sp. IMCC44653]